MRKSRFKTFLWAAVHCTFVKINKRVGHDMSFVTKIFKDKFRDFFCIFSTFSKKKLLELRRLFFGVKSNKNRFWNSIRGRGSVLIYHWLPIFSDKISIALGMTLVTLWLLEFLPCSCYWPRLSWSWEKICTFISHLKDPFWLKLLAAVW